MPEEKQCPISPWYHTSYPVGKDNTYLLHQPSDIHILLQQTTLLEEKAQWCCNKQNFATTTYNFTSETGTQVSTIEMILRCDAGTQVESSLIREASTKITNVNEQLETKTDSGAADKEKEVLQNKTAALEEVLE